MTIENSINDFLNSQNVLALSDSSQDMYRYALQTFRAFSYKGKIEDISEQNLEEFCGWLHDNKKSTSTIKQYLTIVKMWLKASGHPINYSYKSPAGAKKKQQMKQIERMFTEDEVEMILAYEFQNGAALRNKIMVRLLFETGARINEIASIEWKDVTLFERTLWLKTSKTVPRPAFVSSETNLLMSRYRHGPDFNFTGDDDDAEYKKKLFPNVAQCKSVFTNMLIDLGLKRPGRSCHTFRHYFATMLRYDKGVDIDDIAVMLGDTSEIVRSTYLHPTAKHLKGIMDKAMGW